MIAITSPAKADTLSALGAERTLPRDADLVTELGVNSVDVVVDLVAGANWPKLLDVLRPAGRYAVAGAIGGPKVELDVRTLYLKDLNFFGCTVSEPTVFGNLAAAPLVGISPNAYQAFKAARSSLRTLHQPHFTISSSHRGPHSRST